MFSPDDVAEALEAWRRCGRNYSAAGRELSRNDNWIRRRVKAAARLGLIRPQGLEAPPGFEVVEITERTGANGDPAGGSARYRQEAGPAFEMPEGYALERATVQRDSAGRVVRDWQKIKRDPGGALDLEAMRAELEGAPPLPEIALEEKPRAELLNLFPVADLHLRSLTYRQESGADYDSEIAADLFCAGIGQLIEGAPPAEVGVLLGLGDVAHASRDPTVTDASGHVLRSDLTHPMAQRLALRLFRWAVQAMLARHRRVIVVPLPGNHDATFMAALALALAVAFERNPRVSVAETDSRWWFHRWGVVQIGAHHGDAAKPEALPGIMAERAREDWGAARVGRIYTAHTHRRALLTVGQTVVETLDAVCPPCPWAAPRFAATPRGFRRITHHLRAPEISEATAHIPADAATVESPDD